MSTFKILTALFIGLGTLGLFKYRITGAGLIDTTKEMWRPKITEGKN